MFKSCFRLCLKDYSSWLDEVTPTLKWWSPYSKDVKLCDAWNFLKLREMTLFDHLSLSKRPHRLKVRRYQAALRAAEELRANNNVVLQQMKNATRKVSPIESDFLCLRER